MSSQESSSSYNGHTVFRNQPPFTFFNKSIEDPTDTLFLALNEINPIFLSPKQLEQDAKLFRGEVLIDPRNQQQVTEFLIDHTQPQRPHIFRSPQNSTLTKPQHVICLKVLQALQNHDEVSEDNLCLFRWTQDKRDKEKIEFLKYVDEFSQLHNEQIYAPAKQLVELYVAWYRQRAELLITYFPKENYNTHSGLPHLRLCGSSIETDLVDVQVLFRSGQVPVWGEAGVDWGALKSRLATYSEMQLEAMEAREKFSMKNVQKAMEFVPDDGEVPTYFIPLESLLFLLTAGDYPDLPTEMLLDVVDGGWTQFHVPIPSRNCGWHTHNKVVMQALEAQQSVAPTTQWLQLMPQGAEKLKSKVQALSATEEIKAEINAQAITYNPILFEDYLQQLPLPLNSSENKLKFSEKLVKWHLKDNSSEERLRILTTLSHAPAVDVEVTAFLGGLSLKLEYKPQFGCELLTKYELLHEWFTLRLQENHEQRKLHRLRLAASTLKPLLIEQLSVQQLEQQLLATYSVRLPRLLNGLFEFLKLLQNMPAGQHMLRYTPKFGDKLLLCAISQEITQNSISLPGILKIVPTDLTFMTQRQILPIADNVCSIMHRYHGVLPCAFLPLLNFNDSNRKNKTQPSKFHKKPFNDRDFIISRVQKKAIASKAKEKLQKTAHKKHQKRRRRARLVVAKQEAQKKQQEEAELHREIELDKMLMGFD